MRSILRSFAAVILGFVTASILMMIVESINGRVLYPELAKAAAGLKSREALRALFATVPMGALVVVLFGWALGGLVGGWVTAKVAGRSVVLHGVILGALLTLAGFANNLMLPPPLWFWIVSMGVLLPASYLGARLSSR